MTPHGSTSKPAGSRPKRQPSAVPPITDKSTLIQYLTEASVLEHQFMCQYLYAAVSLKKSPDESCSAAEYEHVRRWASTVYLIARQEMEHLSVANSLLTAIGANPFFGHENFPTQSVWYTKAALARKRPADAPLPCDLPFLLEPLNPCTVQRFCCMESPDLEYLVGHDLSDVRNVLDWCFQDSQGNCQCQGSAAAVPLGKSRVYTEANPPDNVQVGTIQELYEAIDAGFVYLAQTLGEKELFSGHSSGQEEIPSEYQVYLFPINDLSSARAAIRMVTEQGEGIQAPPGAGSHFQAFYDIAVDYQAMLARNPSFVPSLPLPSNPQPGQYTQPTARDAAQTFDSGYITLLYFLTGYYALFTTAGAYNKPPALTAALAQSAFAPLMTMLVRSLAEVLTHLPADDTGSPAAPIFYLDPTTLSFLAQPWNPSYGNIDFYVQQMQIVVSGLQNILENDPVPDGLRSKLVFMYENMLRVTNNLGYTDVNGIYPSFNPAITPPACGA